MNRRPLLRFKVGLIATSLLAGAGLKAGTVSRPVTPYDVAPTLANYLGVKPPSGSIGNPLVEIVGD